MRLESVPRGALSRLQSCEKVSSFKLHSPMQSQGRQPRKRLSDPDIAEVNSPGVSLNGQSGLEKFNGYTSLLRPSLGSEASQSGLALTITSPKLPDRKFDSPVLGTYKSSPNLLASRAESATHTARAETQPSTKIRLKNRRSPRAISGSHVKVGQVSPLSPSGESSRYSSGISRPDGGSSSGAYSGVEPLDRGLSGISGVLLPRTSSIHLPPTTSRSPPSDGEKLPEL